jgi:hypothetical protein
MHFGSDDSKNKLVNLRYDGKKIFTLPSAAGMDKFKGVKIETMFWGDLSNLNKLFDYKVICKTMLYDINLEKYIFWSGVSTMVRNDLCYIKL